MSRSQQGIVLVALLVSGFALAWWFGPLHGERLQGPLAQQAYLWQRDWNPSVRQSIANHGPDFSHLILLAGEVHWQAKSPHLTQIPLHYPMLKAQGRPVGLALRISNFSGPFASDDALTRWLRQTTASLLEEALKHGLDVAEFQIDFDCATSHLDGYRLWLESLRQVTSPVPLTITALPTWLNSPAFRRLIKECPHYVLQLHSLEKPDQLDQGHSSFVLCRPDQARASVEKAARYKVPFRVALPTYGYQLAFDEKGHFQGLSAEGPARDWPASTVMREVRARPAVMAELVKTWTQDRPAQLQGLVWYRLPVEGDDLNWSWATLSKVMQGQKPQAKLDLHVRHPQSELVEIDLQNVGDMDFSGPVTLSLRWDTGRMIAGDGLSDFQLQESAPNLLQFKYAGPGLGLRPGKRLTAGWARFSEASDFNHEILLP